MYKIKLFSKLFGESLVIQHEDGSISHYPLIFPHLQNSTIAKYQHLEQIAFFKTIKEAQAVAKEIIKIEKEKAGTEAIHHFEIIKCFSSR
jgi:hypothetical protein